MKQSVDWSAEGVGLEVYESKASPWRYWIPAFLSLLLIVEGFTGSILHSQLPALWLVIGLSLSLLLFIHISRIEVVVTDRAVVLKKGLAGSCKVLGFNDFSELEVKQSFFGSIFGYGTIVFKLPNKNAIKMPAIEEPYIIIEEINSLNCKA